MIAPSSVYLRDYSKIYTGTNQEYGYETPFLGFVADTTEIVFQADKSTYFHYPRTALPVQLSATDIIQSGAFASNIPYKSDKIFKKQADYDNHTPWGNSLPENMQKGVWLCAWLSGNEFDPTITPIWMDRWYEPGYLDSTQALFASSISAVYDEPSRMTFDPGSWYKYDHIGSNANLQIVNKIKNLKVHLDDWNETTIDQSGNNNNAVLVNFTKNMIGNSVNPLERPKDSSLKLDGNRQYGEVLYNKTFDVSGNITCNVWIKSANWRNPQNQHIISNGFRGGWHLGVNTGFFTPFVTMIDISGNFVFMNQDGKVFKDMKLPGNSFPISTLIDSELYTWVLDNGIYDNKKHLYRIDFDGNIDKGIEFPAEMILYDIIVDFNNNIWALSNTGCLTGFDMHGNLKQITPPIFLNKNKLVINKQNQISAYDAFDVCVMDNNTYWIADKNGNLYKNDMLFLSGFNITNVQCPKGDDVYALYDYDKIMFIRGVMDDINNIQTFIIGATAQIPDLITAEITGRNISFTNEYENGNYVDYLWITQPNTGYVYKYTKDLNLVKKTNITYVKNSIYDSVILGDYTSYNWHRLFNYPKLKKSNTPQVEGVVYLGTGMPLLTGQKFKVTMPVTDLSKNDWHMFSFIIDNNSNSILLYVDAILRSVIDIPELSKIYYKYETAFTLGTNIGKIMPLDIETGKLDKLYFNGNIDDVRIYINTLNNSDIRHLYLTKFDFKDLIWNIPTGLQSYVEEIVKFFKFKMPGQKSQFYNIRLVGLQISDPTTREIIEEVIKNTVNKIAPLYTSLYKIIWD